jgi:iron complex transport system permease protein
MSEAQALRSRELGRARRLGTGGLAAALCLALAVAVFAALAIGARAIPPADVVAALVSPDLADPEHIVVQMLRLPRLLCGMLVGAALGVAGAQMQALTRNPLADPGLLGVNAGAALAVVLALHLGAGSSAVLPVSAFAGAGIAASAVYALGSMGRGAASPLRLALAGAALSALLFALVQAVLLMDQAAIQSFRFWIVGGIADAQMDTIGLMLPALAAGLLLAWWSAGPLDSVALGEEAAIAQGTRIALTRAAVLACVTLLCGASVALAGPIGFVGLVVPHVARALAGPRQRACVLISIAIGPILLLSADVAGRVVMPPGEVPAGAMCALLGGPAFILIVRRMRIAQP